MHPLLKKRKGMKQLLPVFTASFSQHYCCCGDAATRSFVTGTSLLTL